MRPFLALKPGLGVLDAGPLQLGLGAGGAQRLLQLLDPSSGFLSLLQQRAQLGLSGQGQDLAPGGDVVLDPPRLLERADIAAPGL